MHSSHIPSPRRLRVCLINPRFHPSIWTRDEVLSILPGSKRSWIVTGSLPALAALAPEHCDVVLVDENVEDIDFEQLGDFDIVGVTGMTSKLWDADPDPTPDVPVARPRLPTADDILPYLREIDANRWYSNNGPLNQRFQEGLRARIAVGHATKALGVGEGCFIASDDGALIDEIVKKANFGFANSREAASPALNGKLSEYGAAVGLAALDGWTLTRAAYQRVARGYCRSLASTSGVNVQDGFGERWISSTVTVGLPSDSMETALNVLTQARIGVRRWWGGGLHRHTAFEHFPKVPLPVTETLVATQLGLPCWTDLSDEAISRICSILTDAMTAG